MAPNPRLACRNAPSQSFRFEYALIQSLSHVNRLNVAAIALSDETRIAVSKDQVWCDLAGDAAILNLKNGVYYGLDPVGARIWNLIQEPKTLAEVRDTLLGQYDVDKERLESDLRVLLTQLAEQGLIDIHT